MNRRVLHLISQIKHKLYHEFIPTPKPKERLVPALGDIIREELDRDPATSPKKKVVLQPKPKPKTTEDEMDDEDEKESKNPPLIMSGKYSDDVKHLRDRLSKNHQLLMLL